MKERSGAYRVFYFIEVETAVLIFHAFQKKTPRTPPHEIKLARARLKEML
jgi:phage-related protein